MRAPTPARERERLEELHAYGVLDSLPEQASDDITLLASQICESPIALISLVDEERQWFKSRLGIDAAETHRDEAFCAYAIVYPDELLVVEDATLDERFADKPLVVSESSIRFYAGAPLVAPSGNALGTICVIDREARSLSPGQGRALRALARQVVAQLELGRVVGELEKAAAEKERYQNQLEGYQKTLEDQLAVIAERSVTDPLTGVRNRRAFMDRLREEVERSRRSEAPVSLALLDVDHFKSFNDEFGHQAGDAALVQVAGLIEKHSRTLDTVARFGGEEFVVVLPNTDLDGAFVLAERFRKAIQGADWDHRAVTVSIGVSSTVGADPDDLIRAADEALYQAKDAGRNRTSCADAA